MTGRAVWRILAGYCVLLAGGRAQPAPTPEAVDYVYQHGRKIQLIDIKESPYVRILRNAIVAKVSSFRRSSLFCAAMRATRSPFPGIGTCRNRSLTRSPR
jgi:hypothetical protein